MHSLYLLLPVFVNCAVWAMILYMRNSILLLLLVVPVFAIAHTSDERYVDGFVVDLSTAPIAPWVGEKTGMSFSFIDAKTLTGTSSVQTATLAYESYIAPGAKHAEMSSESETFAVTDGGFVASHTFMKEGIYDMHLSFTDNSGNTHLAGFRKQVRVGEIPTAQGVGLPAYILSLVSIGGLLFFIGRLSAKR